MATRRNPKRKVNEEEGRPPFSPGGSSRSVRVEEEEFVADSESVGSTGSRGLPKFVTKQLASDIEKEFGGIKCFRDDQARQSKNQPSLPTRKKQPRLLPWP